MVHFGEEEINSISYSDFIPYLQGFYRWDISVPERPHYEISGARDAVLLLMPSWRSGGYIGVKVITVYPENPSKDIPSIQGIFLLMDADDGRLLASFDGPALTTKRTAAVSALGASIVSKQDIDTMLMIGTGKLCHELIKAHSSARPIEKVYIWGRNPEKARIKAATYGDPSKVVIPIKDRFEHMGKVGLISSATYAKDPLIEGDKVAPGTHIDLVGSYTSDCREADDNCLKGNALFVDNMTALKETGDLVIPMKQGVIQKEDILADLKHLVSNGFIRASDDQVTVFKSVGNAQSDLALAVYLYERQFESEKH